MNMYTRPEYRRKGIAYKTLDILISETKDRGITDITLEATDMGRPLYEKYGFYDSLTNAVKLKDGFSMLDVGRGTGTILSRLSQKASINGYGIDVSVVMACMAYHHFPSQEKFRKEAFRILKPNGRLYICDPRFPLPIRAAMNGIFRISNTNACFYHSTEMNRDFTEDGFSVKAVRKDFYVQTLIYKKN